ncbi:hypothetical protein MRX96_039522 [Rhipicephalus microplus]
MPIRAAKGNPRPDPGPGLLTSVTPAVFCHARHSAFRLIGLRGLRSLRMTLRDGPFDLDTDHCLIWPQRVRGHIDGFFQTLHCCLVEIFSVTLIVATNTASAVPRRVIDTAANAATEAFGRNWENAEE